MWIKNLIVTIVKEGETIEKDVVHMSMPPTFKARSYQVMWVFGNHIRVSSAKEHLTTCDTDVVLTFEQKCVSIPNDYKLVLATLEYVGWVEEI
jgi:hypothetical protein